MKEKSGWRDTQTSVAHSAYLLSLPAKIMLVTSAFLQSSTGKAVLAWAMMGRQSLLKSGCTVSGVLNKGVNDYGKDYI